MEEAKERTYICVNCGAQVESLFRKYSPTVLKLTECIKCGGTTDIYIEYDPVIVMIDLVLLKKAAYRHILFNADFKNVWKMAITLLLMESYSEWTFKHSDKVKSEEHPSLSNMTVNTLTEIMFYKICIDNMIRTIFFLKIIYLLTLLYCLALKLNLIPFMTIWKGVTLSSFGLFLLLPSVIWDTSSHELHWSVVFSYTLLSQLSAYAVMTECSKKVAITILFLAYNFKTVLSDIFISKLNTLILNFFDLRFDNFMQDTIN